MIREQVLVGLPTYVMEDCSLLRWNHYRFHVVSIVLKALVDSTHMIEYYSETVVVRRAERMGK
jgi:hypothetical protein